MLAALGPAGDDGEPLPERWAMRMVLLLEQRNAYRSELERVATTCRKAEMLGRIEKVLAG